MCWICISDTFIAFGIFSSLCSGSVVSICHVIGDKESSDDAFSESGDYLYKIGLMCFLFFIFPLLVCPQS